MLLDINKSIEEFKNSIHLFSDICQKNERFLTSLLNESNIKYLTISSRVKDENKLRNKLLKSASKYSSIYDVTDISGLRIITYFEDEIDDIAKIVEKEYIIDWENSIDKRKVLDPNSFGYLSLHYIVQNKKNEKLSKQSENIRFEIQIRSILQHAWAEIEHDLGYKSEIEVPYEVRRRFSRIASLLEMADIEFVSIKYQLKLYEDNVIKNIQGFSKNISINKVSIKSFLKENNSSLELDKTIAKLIGANLEINNEFISVLLKILFFHKIINLEILYVSINTFSTSAIEFAKIWLGNKKTDLFNYGIGIWYIGLIKVLLRNSKQELEEYINFIGIGHTSDRSALINNLEVAYKEFKKHNPKFSRWP
jgi:GTP pyrophosphokinase